MEAYDLRVYGITVFIQHLTRKLRQESLGLTPHYQLECSSGPKPSLSTLVNTAKEPVGESVSINSSRMKFRRQLIHRGKSPPQLKDENQHCKEFPWLLLNSPQVISFLQYTRIVHYQTRLETVKNMEITQRQIRNLRWMFHHFPPHTSKQNLICLGHLEWSKIVQMAEAVLIFQISDKNISMYSSAVLVFTNFAFFQYHVINLFQ